MRTKWLSILISVGLFGIALGIRVYRLEEVPFGLFGDEAVNGLDAVAVLDGRHALFFERNFGREPLFMYLQAALIAVLGAEPYALRFTAALVGALTVPATYWMVRAAFRNVDAHAQWIALYSALFLAFSYWHLNFSRIGFRAICLPLFATLAMYFFWRAWSQIQNSTRVPWRDSMLCGVCAGVALYTYTAARFLPVLIVFLLLWGWITSDSARARPKQLLATALIFGTVCLLVFAPLGYYFFQHPDAFLGRANHVSIFHPIFGEGNPLRAFAESTLKLIANFVYMPDFNLRHNPAQRALFEPLLAVFLVIGTVLAGVRWRILPYVAFLIWGMVFALPSMLTAEGLPHSLRSIGMMPAVYVLATLGVFSVGRPLLRIRPALYAWLPLPILIYSAVLGMNDYFSAWEENSAELEMAFTQDYIDFAAYLPQEGNADEVWLIPISKNYELVQNSMVSPLYFMYKGTLDLQAVVLDKATIAEQLRTVTAGKRRAYILNVEDAIGYEHAMFVYGDPKNLLRFVLRMHADRIVVPDSPDDSLIADAYTLPESSDYEIEGNVLPLSIAFDDAVTLTGVEYGAILPLNYASNEAEDNAAEARVGAPTAIPSGEPIWVMTEWEALTDVDRDLKVRLDLKDATGRVLDQADSLLVSDLYPRERTWASNTRTSAYHILTVEPATPPGEYALLVRVYDDETLRDFPIRHDNADETNGPPVFEALVETVVLTRSVAAPVIAPQHSRHVAMQADVSLLGYDLPEATAVQPGAILPLTLYWQAAEPPAEDYVVRMWLEAAMGDGPSDESDGLNPVAQWEKPPASGTYPATHWQAHEMVRDRHALHLPPDIENGDYEIYVALIGREHAGASVGLGQLTIAGPPRLFEQPAVQTPASAMFGNHVRLVGVNTEPPLEVAAGAELGYNLVWQVETPSAQSLVRFVHLFDGQANLVAQQDTIGCAGNCPAAMWYPTEYLVDPVTLQVPSDLTPGRYAMGVGWYDAATFERIAAFDAEGNPVAGDLYTLPVWVEVGE